MGRDTAAVAVTVDGFAQTAAEGHLVPVVDALDDGKGAEVAAFAFALRLE
jgi:hypothetical protein